MNRAEIEISIQELYIGILGRAADFAGLDYWAGQIESGALTLEHTRASFATPSQPEYWQTYGGLSNSALVNKVYENFLERAPDAAGKAYWEAELDTGAVTSDLFINAVISAAKNPAATDAQTLIDKQVLANKVESALHFTSKTQTADSSSAAYIAEAKMAVASVGADMASVAAAKAAAEQYAASLPPPKLYNDVANDAADFAPGYALTTPISSNAHVEGMLGVRYSATDKDTGDIYSFKAPTSGELQISFVGASTIDVKIFSKTAELMDNYLEHFFDEKGVLNYQEKATVFAGEEITIAVSGGHLQTTGGLGYMFDLAIV